MAVYSALQLNQIANEVNTTIVNNCVNEGYEYILDAAKQGQYRTSFEFFLRNHNVPRVIVQLKDILEGIEIRAEESGNMFRFFVSWDMPDENMPPLVSLGSIKFPVE